MDALIASTALNWATLYYLSCLAVLAFIAAVFAFQEHFSPEGATAAGQDDERLPEDTKWDGTALVVLLWLGLSALIMGATVWLKDPAWSDPPRETLIAAGFPLGVGFVIAILTLAALIRRPTFPRPPWGLVAAVMTFLAATHGVWNVKPFW